MNTRFSLLPPTSQEDDAKRNKFIKHAKYLLGKLCELAPFDAAADGMALEFLHASMPPTLTEEERAMR